MSWNKLKSTFGQVRRTHSYKRKWTNTNSQKKMTNFPVMKMKRPRLNALEAENYHPESNDSDENFEYDPDYDDYCNGCLNRSVRETLPIVTCKVPSKKQAQGDRSPFRDLNSIQENSPSKSVDGQLLFSHERQKHCKNLNWNPLEQTFRELYNDRRLLAKSIVTVDSDESENSENSLNQSLIIQSTQSSGQSCDTHKRLEQTNHPIEKQDASSLFGQVLEASSCNTSFSRKIQCRKGGLVEKLRRVINRHKSEYAFWYHAQRSELVSDGIRARIKDIHTLYGRKFMTIVDREGDEVSVVISENEKYEIGKDINIKLDPQCYIVKNKRFYLGYNKIIKL